VAAANYSGKLQRQRRLSYFTLIVEYISLVMTSSYNHDCLTHSSGTIQIQIQMPYASASLLLLPEANLSSCLTVGVGLSAALATLDCFACFFGDS
jgi:hypothetical protein